jgi:hypothetical protein
VKKNSAPVLEIAAVFSAIALTLPGCATTRTPNDDASLVPPEIVEAVEAGDPEGFHRLAVWHRDGLGGDADPKLAARWFTRAARRGHAPSQAALGVLYFRGEGVPEDLQLASMWFERAAAQEDPDGLCGLAILALEGFVDDADPVEAYAWALLAARRGNEYASRLIEEEILVRLSAEQREEGEERAADWDPSELIETTRGEP